jgi:hypothetical protein
MNKKLLFLVALCSMGMAGKAQTNVFPADGNVGIGTTSPQAKLDVVGGDINIYGTKYSTSGDRARLYFGDYKANIAAVYDYGLYFSPANSDDAMVIRQSGNVGIGTANPQAKLDVRGAGSSNGAWKGRIVASGENNAVVLGEYNGKAWFGAHNAGLTAWTDLIMQADGGNIGVGTTVPDQKLTVKGKIHAEEVIVDLNVPVADYVFAKDYDLMPLHKVEQYVQKNSHLPDIPSATEIKEQGLSMGEMQNKLLKKIEEQTLYIISLNKQIIQQNQKIEKLENEIREFNK